MSSLSPADQLIYSAVRLSIFKQGVPAGTGTGFFYRVPLGADRQLIAIITNKHVLEGVDRVSATFHVGRGGSDPVPTGEIMQWDINLGPQGIWLHPDPEVDLCAFNISDVLNKADQQGKPLFFVTLDRSTIPTDADWENFDSIEELTMVGCPRGIFDETNNIPIVRRGISATPLAKRYNGKARFMIDMACFPGSSGSPVFVFNRDGFLDRKAKTYMMGRTRLFFVGVLFAGPLITNSGNIVLGQTPTIEVATMMHLGYALRSTEVFAFEDEILRLNAAAAAPAGANAT